MADGQRTRVVRDYEFVRQLGRGAMGTVHLARQRRADRMVAVKELTAPDEVYAQRFAREARLAGSLQHANIVPVFETFEEGGRAYIVMRYLKGGSLRDYVKGITAAQCGGALEGMLAGLAHAHSHKIVHRDLKPENILVSEQGLIEIGDFGLAKATDQLTAAGLTPLGTALGTPVYMAPEQGDAKPVDGRTDLYAVGVMAYEMMCGTPPFPKTLGPMQMLLAHATEPVPPVRSKRPQVPKPWARWVERLLEKDPANRPASAQEAWDELDEILTEALGPRWRRYAALDHQPEARPQQAPRPSDDGTLPLGAVTEFAPEQTVPIAAAPAAPPAPDPDAVARTLPPPPQPGSNRPGTGFPAFQAPAPAPRGWRRLFGGRKRKNG